jgi:homoserine dehydrogenase
LEDINSAQKAGKVIKLLGRALRAENGTVYIIVAPHLVDCDCPLSKVDDVYNGVIVNGNVLGEVMFYGQGAGKYPTASAVMADVIDASKHITARKYLDWDDSDASVVYDYTKWESVFMVRCESEAARKLFDLYGHCETIQVKGGISSVITPKLPEEKHSEIFEKAGGVISAIRVYN